MLLSALWLPLYQDKIYTYDSKIKSTHHYSSNGSKFHTSENTKVFKVGKKMADEGKMADVERIKKNWDNLQQKPMSKYN